MRILAFSNAPWVYSGYGNQIATFIRYAKRSGIEVGCVCNNGLIGGIVNYDGVPCFPIGKHIPMSQSVKYWHDKFNADFVLSLADIFTIQDFFEPREYMESPGEGMKIVPWVPVDHKDVSSMIWKPLQKAHSVVAMSKFGKEELRKKGIFSTYIPHGVDTSMFRPLGDKGKWRQALSFDKEDFVVGIVGANKGSRKHIAEQMMAFAKFSKNHQDAKLYLHMNLSQGDGGYDLAFLAKELGIQDKTSASHPNNLISGLSPEAMNQLYNGFDVLLHCSKGEGFGIPIIEAQAAGTPVLATRFSSMTELVDGDWLMDSSSYDMIVHGGYRANVSPDAIAEKLERIYQNRKHINPAICRERVLQYDNDKVWKDHWMPFLKELGFADCHSAGQDKEKVLSAV